MKTDFCYEMNFLLIQPTESPENAFLKNWCVFIKMKI